MLLSSPAQAAPAERRNWIFEHWLLPVSSSSGTGVPRLETQFQASSFRDSGLGSVRGRFDLGYLDLGTRFSSLGFLNLTEQGMVESSHLVPEGLTAGIELGRRYLYHKEVAARIAAEWLRGFPSTKQWLRLGLSTNLLEKAERPWTFGFQFQYVLALSASENSMGVRFEILRHFSLLRFGGALAWTYWVRAVGLADPLGTENYDNMLFSLMPVMEWVMGAGTLHFAVPLRLSVDQQLLASNGAVATRFPTDLSADFTLAWSRQW